MDSMHKKVIGEEIDRCKREWQNAQDRYAVTGSRSSDKTMEKYMIIQDALEGYMTAEARTYELSARLERIKEIARLATVDLDNGYRLDTRGMMERFIRICMGSER